MAHVFLITTIIAPAMAAVPAMDLTAHIQNAAQQTGIPEVIIRAVIDAESGGRAHIVSAKGAIGFMQIMPGTWTYLRAKMNLGNDPFDGHDNILAGTTYLRTLYDAYGWNGFLAAYNAGPGRYEDYRDTGRALPSETRFYVARITANLDRSNLTFGPNRAVPTEAPWTTAALFATTVTNGTSGVAPFQSADSPFVTLPVSDATPPSE